jgi:hypothetical protein
MKLEMNLTMKVCKCVASGRIYDEWEETFTRIWDAIQYMNKLDSDNDFYYHVYLVDDSGYVHFDDSLL